MIFVVIFSILYIVLFFTDILPLLKKKNLKKEFIIVLVIVSIVYIAQILDVIGIQMPSTSRGIDSLVKIYKSTVKKI